MDIHLTDEELNERLLVMCETVVLGELFCFGHTKFELTAQIYASWKTVCRVSFADIYFLEPKLDIASYEKELRDGTANVNFVTFLLKHGIDGRRFVSSSAVKEYIGQIIIPELEAKLHDCLGAALKNSLGQKGDIGRWLNALPYIVSGNTWWTQLVSVHADRRHIIIHLTAPQTTRYNIPGHPVPRKIIHLEDIGDIVEPEPAI